MASDHHPDKAFPMIRVLHPDKVIQMTLSDPDKSTIIMQPGGSITDKKPEVLLNNSVANQDY